MDTTNNTSSIIQGWTEDEEWLDDTIFKECNFEDWLEDELRDMEVPMEMEPSQVIDSEQDDMALGLEISTQRAMPHPVKLSGVKIMTNI